VKNEKWEERRQVSCKEVLRIRENKIKIVTKQIPKQEKGPPNHPQRKVPREQRPEKKIEKKDGNCAFGKKNRVEMKTTIV